jgi:hypothetical protein
LVPAWCNSFNAYQDNHHRVIGQPLYKVCMKISKDDIIDTLIGIAIVVIVIAYGFICLI